MMAKFASVLRRLAVGAFLVALCTSSMAQLPSSPATEPASAESNDIRVVGSPDYEAIRERIEAVLDAIDELQQIQVEVAAGVVTLSGMVPNARSSRAILDIANRVEGVIYVRDRLEEEVAISARLRPTTRRVQEMGATALRMLPMTLLAITVIVAFWYLGQWLGRREKLFRRLGLSELAINLGRRVTRLLVIGLGFLLALELLDATALVSALLGVAGVAGIAVGFAFRNIAENYLAGVLLSARNPFAIGDEIQIGEFLGHVIRLTSRDTVLMTRDGNHLRIPNSVIITSTMTNFTRNPLRRFAFNVSVGNRVDLLAARELGVATLKRQPGVLSHPATQVTVAELGDSTVLLRFHAWINQRDTDILRARSEAIRLVKHAFDCENIDMPEPAYRIVMDGDAGADVAATPVSRQGKSSATREPSAQTEEILDVSADRSIDEQVAHELRESDEENLLKKE